MAVQSMLEAMEGMLYLLVLRRDCALSTKVPEVPEVLEMMRCVQICMLEAVEGRFSLLEVPEVMRRVLLCMLDVFEALEVMRCVPLCIWRRWRVGSVCWTCRM